MGNEKSSKVAAENGLTRKFRNISLHFVERANTDRSKCETSCLLKMRAGFTLVELMVVVSLSVLAVTLLVYSLSQVRYTSDFTTRKQNLQNLINQMMTTVRKDLRSSEEAYVSPFGVKLNVYQLAKTGLPESHEVMYIIDNNGVERRDGSSRKKFEVTQFLKKDDFFSINLIHNAPLGTGFYLEIFIIDAYGKELVRQKERLLKISVTND